MGNHATFRYEKRIKNPCSHPLGWEIDIYGVFQIRWNRLRSNYAVKISFTVNQCVVITLFIQSVCVCPQGYLPPTKNGVEPKRPSRPINITSLVRLSTTVPNTIVVSWTSEIGRVRLKVNLIRDCVLFWDTDSVCEWVWVICRTDVLQPFILQLPPCSLNLC